MASVTGKATAYDLTNGLIVNMDEAIYMYSPEELPLLTGMASDGLSVLSQRPLDQIAFSWLDERNLAPRSTVSATTAVVTTDVTVNLAAGDGLKFSTGDVLIIRKAGVSQPELIQVTAITTDVLTITRAFNSIGTATNYAIGAQVVGLGTALAEGSTPANFRADDTTTTSNNTQIFGPTQIQMTGTSRVVPRYGIPDQWAHQLHLRTYENAQSREQALLYGRASNSTTTKIRTMGGIVEFVTTNIDSTSTQLTALKLQANLQLAYNQGGLPDRLIVNPASLLDLNDIGNTAIVRQTVEDPKRGRTATSFVETEFGSLPIVRDRWCAPSDAFGIKRDGCVRRILRPLNFESLAKTGDFDSGQIVCEESLQVKGQKHMFRMTALGY
jgi:hypothetical protein